MERSISGHDYSDEDDRRSRLPHPTNPGNGSMSHRERATSQPPRSSGTSIVSSPPTQGFMPSGHGGGWPSSRIVSPGRGQPMPVRSSSFSGQQQAQFSSAMRERAFPSTFEDVEEDESEFSEYDDRFMPSSLHNRGRPYGQDLSRSRSQSLATTRPLVGSPYTGVSAMQSWNESYLSQASNPLSIPSNSSRYGEIKPPGSSRYGSLGTLGRDPSDFYSSSPTSSAYVHGTGNGIPRQQPNADISNISPFVRDVGTILHDDIRELWPGIHPPRDAMISGDGGGSGTTSRRHSVSVVGPRRPNVVGFNAPTADLSQDEPANSRSSFQSGFGTGRGGGGGLRLGDDDLASELGGMSLDTRDAPAPPTPTSHLPPSQPSSLPIYAPLSRSPPSRDLMSAYQPINLNIPSSGYSRPIDTPSEGDLSAGGNSPRQGMYEQHLVEQHYNRPQQQQQQQPDMSRFVPSYFTQQQQQQPPSPQYARARAPSYSSASGGLTSPISPTAGGRTIVNPQQPPFYPQQQRRASDAHAHGHAQSPSTQNPPPTPSSATLSDLGKGVPLHSVPPTWPLFIVEFKAGRTDLFYTTDLGLDVRVGDLVVVEADRGKDLGKVVNDRITIGEVEVWVRQQQQHQQGPMSGDGAPTSPGGAGSAGGQSASAAGGLAAPAVKKEISPKMIYGKAGPHELSLLQTKTQDEAKALALCQSKVRAKKLPMEVIDAEYQWDRRKLTFYFIAEKRIDFRELVRELFRLYKTRIWMASLQGGGGFEQ